MQGTNSKNPYLAKNEVLYIFKVLDPKSSNSKSDIRKTEDKSESVQKNKDNSSILVNVPEEKSGKRPHRCAPCGKSIMIT
jgi:hypothetical protein